MPETAGMEVSATTHALCNRFVRIDLWPIADRHANGAAHGCGDVGYVDEETSVVETDGVGAAVDGDSITGAGHGVVGVLRSSMKVVLVFGLWFDV